jgi:hypothetical protein
MGVGYQVADAGANSQVGKGACPRLSPSLIQARHQIIFGKVKKKRRPAPFLTCKFATDPAPDTRNPKLLRFAPRAGMVFVVRIPQMSISDVRVDLRSRDIAVPQQSLHRTRVGAVLEQMSGEAMP